MALCYVSAADYARYWNGQGAVEAPAWDGANRRRPHAQMDRRRRQRDQRWTSEQGRRRYAGPHDRRQS